MNVGFSFSPWLWVTVYVLFMRMKYPWCPLNSATERNALAFTIRRLWLKGEWKQTSSTYGSANFLFTSSEESRPCWLIVTTKNKFSIMMTCTQRSAAEILQCWQYSRDYFTVQRCARIKNATNPSLSNPFQFISEFILSEIRLNCRFSHLNKSM